MTFASRAVGLSAPAAASGGVNTGFTGSVSNTSALTGIRSASVTLNSDGSTTVTGTGSVTNWYLPTTASIGTSYWVRFTESGSIITWSGAATGTWLALSAGQTVTAENSSSTLEGLGSVTVEIATSAAGAGAVRIGYVSFDVGHIA